MSNLARDVQAACVWEATARKAGNVHPFASFDNLTYADFLQSAKAIAPVMEQMVDQPLGVSILEAIRATRDCVSSNTNLGIVLLLAPLTKCRPDPDGLWNWAGQLRALIDATTREDARNVYQAIRLASPGGMGKVENQDVADKPTGTLGEVMALAADRDLIARQYTNGFRDVIEFGVPALLDGWARFGRVETAILACQLQWLSRFPDSLIVRKLGPAVAREAMQRAQAVDLAAPGGWERYAEFDRWLRADGHKRNPRTTADLVTACLFVALRERRMEHTMPFDSGVGKPWEYSPAPEE